MEDDDTISAASTHVSEAFSVFSAFLESLSKRQLRILLANTVAPAATKKLLRHMVFHAVSMEDRNRKAIISSIERMLQAAVDSADALPQSSDSPMSPSANAAAPAASSAAMISNSGPTQPSSNSSSSNLSSAIAKPA